MRKQNTLVSIIVPIYNVEKYLNKCIESIIGQDYSNIEIVLVDDGSPDNSGDIIDEYARKDKRIKPIHKINCGVSTARNTGIENATGDYICFVDGDDYVMPDYVSYLLRLSEENDADIALTTDMFGNFNEKQNTNLVINNFTAEQATEQMLCYKYPIGVYCKLFRRSFIEENKIRFFTDIFIGEGFNFNMECIQRSNRVTVGNKKIYYYRRDNEASAMSSFSLKKWENGLYALENIKNNLLFHTEKINSAWRFAWWRTNTDAYNSIVLAEETKEYRDFYFRCKSVVMKNGLIAIKVPVSINQKLRAIVMVICPKLIPLMMKIRKKRYIG